MAGGLYEVEHETAARFVLPATGETIEILPGSIIEAEVIYREIFEDGLYSKHGVAVRPGDVVVDVGANIGMFCLHIASSTAAARRTAGINTTGTSSGSNLCTPAAISQPVTYYGIEALPPVFEVLRRNVDVAVGMRKPDVRMSVKALLNVALGDDVRADVPATLFPRLPGNSTLNPEERIRFQHGIVEPRFFEGARQYLVPMRTLSDVMEEHGIERVDFLKMDVEGAEVMVLRGIKEAHWSRIWQVVVEVPDVDEETNNNGTIVPIKRIHLIIRLLEKHGFVVNADFDPNGKNYMVYARRL